MIDLKHSSEQMIYRNKNIWLFKKRFDGLNIYIYLKGIVPLMTDKSQSYMHHPFTPLSITISKQ
jgi:hypothetical protein